MSQLFQFPIYFHFEFLFFFFVQKYYIRIEKKIVQGEFKIVILNAC